MTKCILDIKSGKCPPWCSLQTAAYTMLDTPIDFEEKGHVYTFNGQRFGSVTEILKSKGYIDSSHYDDYSQNRGSNVHLICHLDDIDDLIEETVGDVERPYLEAYRKFKRESGFVVEESEVPKANLKYMFAGTADKRGHFPSGTLKRAALELHDDGTYKLIPFTDRQDVGIFLSELPGFFWKLNH